MKRKRPKGFETAKPEKRSGDREGQKRKLALIGSPVPGERETNPNFQKKKGTMRILAAKGEPSGQELFADGGGGEH